MKNVLSVNIVNCFQSPTGHDDRRNDHDASTVTGRLRTHVTDWYDTSNIQNIFLFHNSVPDPSRSQNFLTAGSLFPLIWRNGFPLKRHCRSESVRSSWIWIRVRSGNVDPDLEERILTKINKKTWFQAFQKGFCTCKAVLRVHDIWGWIRIRIRGSIPLTNESGSGSGSWIRILLFSSLTFKMPAKI